MKTRSHARPEVAVACLRKETIDGFSDTRVGEPDGAAKPLISWKQQACHADIS